MIDNHFRALLPRFTGGLVQLYRTLGLTPNQITLLSLPVAVTAATCVALKWNTLAILIWWLGRLLDGTDGIYARATNQTSGFGAYLDIVCDMAAYSLMVFGFFVAYPELAAGWMVILFFYVLCIASALALGIEEDQAGIGRRDSRGLRLGAGLAEGGETGIAYTLFLLFPDQLPWMIWVWAFVLLVTVIARSLLARATLTQFL